MGNRTTAADPWGGCSPCPLRVTFTTNLSMDNSTSYRTPGLPSYLFFITTCIRYKPSNSTDCNSADHQGEGQTAPVVCAYADRIEQQRQHEHPEQRGNNPTDDEVHSASVAGPISWVTQGRGESLRIQPPGYVVPGPSLFHKMRFGGVR